MNRMSTPAAFDYDSDGDDDLIRHIDDENNGEKTTFSLLSADPIGQAESIFSRGTVGPREFEGRLGISPCSMSMKWTQRFILRAEIKGRGLSSCRSSAERELTHELPVFAEECWDMQESARDVNPCSPPQALDVDERRRLSSMIEALSFSLRLLNRASYRCLNKAIHGKSFGLAVFRGRSAERRRWKIAPISIATDSKMWLRWTADVHQVGNPEKVSSTSIRAMGTFASQEHECRFETRSVAAAVFVDFDGDGDQNTVLHAQLPESGNSAVYRAPEGFRTKRSGAIGLSDPPRPSMGARGRWPSPADLDGELES